MEDAERLTVLAAGGANVDIKVKIVGGLSAGHSTPGEVHLCPGGAARNVAEALARMGSAVRLLTAVGEDALGTWLLAETSAAGIDCTRVLRRQGQTGVYVNVGGAGVADASIVESVAPQTWPADLTAAPSVVVLDANLLPPALAHLATSAPRLALIGTSVAKVNRLRTLLPRAWLICLTAAEATALVAVDGAGRSGEALARLVQDLGPAQVLLTEGEEGLGLLGEHWTAQAARRTPSVVDPTGAGDVAAAAVIFGLAAGLEPPRVLAAAAEAAAMTVGEWGNVPAKVGTVWKDAEWG